MVKNASELANTGSRMALCVDVAMKQKLAKKLIFEWFEDEGSAERVVKTMK